MKVIKGRVVVTDTKMSSEELHDLLLKLMVSVENQAAGGCEDCINDAKKLQTVDMEAV